MLVHQHDDISAAISGRNARTPQIYESKLDPKQLKPTGVSIFGHPNGLPLCASIFGGPIKPKDELLYDRLMSGKLSSGRFGYAYRKIQPDLAIEIPRSAILAWEHRSTPR
jgi:hypothetical protein